MVLRVHDIVRTTLTDSIEPALPRRREGLDELYTRHWTELVQYLKKRFGAGRPDPEDVAQEAFIRFAALEDRRDIDNPRAYLYRTAHNVLVDEHRRLAVRAADARRADRAPQSDDRTPERVLVGQERLDLMSATLHAMPAARRRSFLLNRLHGHSCAAIARMTGYSESAVKKHIDLALTDLDAALTAAEHRAAGL